MFKIILKLLLRFEHYKIPHELNTSLNHIANLWIELFLFSFFHTKKQLIRKVCSFIHSCDKYLFDLIYWAYNDEQSRQKIPAFMEVILLVKSSSHRDIIISLPFRHRAVLEPRPPVKSFTKHLASGQYSLAVAVLRSQQRADIRQWKFSGQLSSLWPSPQLHDLSREPSVPSATVRLHLLCSWKSVCENTSANKILKDASACKILWMYLYNAWYSKWRASR